MSLNQNIRFKEPNPSDTNNPQGLYPYLITGQNLSGAGVPNPLAGTLNSRYIDTLSGIEYIKINYDTWEQYIDYSGFAPPPPPPSIPDPLEVGELRTDLLKGKTSDSITLDGGLNGDINITLGASNAFSVNSGVLEIRGDGLISNTSNNSFIIEQKQTGEDIEIKAESVGAGNVILRAGTGGGQVQTTENLSLQGKDLINVEKVQHTTATTFIMENTSNNQDVLIRTTGAGNLRLNSGAANIEHETPARFVPFGITTSSINASHTLTQDSIIAVSSSGVIEFGKVPQTIIFSGINIGVNGVNYLDCFNIDPNPGQVPVCPILNGGKIRRVEAALLFDSPWTWGGATTANIEFGYIALNSPITTANWTPLFNLSMEPTLDYYYTNSTANITMPAGKLGCRLNIVGATPTASTAEIIIKVQLY